MPSGKVHDRITTVGTILSLPIALHYTHDLGLSTIASASFYFTGYMFGPDLDMAHSKPSKRWGIFRFVWVGYRKRIATYHRHPFSHFPLLGTIARVIYLGAWVALAILLLNPILRLLTSFAQATEISIAYHWPTSFDWRFQDWNPVEDYRIWCCAIGLEVGAASHYIPDYLSSWVKEWRE